ncbi:hypothetical protein RLOatenuis_1610 [Rickettsiales bacterium]|nr:hypothetical protein RLOatenuis_1610 [Rickettsiales bacterium]
MLLKILAALFLLTSCTGKRLNYPAKIDKVELHEQPTISVYNKVYFDSGSAELNESARIILRAQAEWLKKLDDDSGSKYKIKIEGHSDERGSRECNLTLGMARANAAKKYLVFLGIDPNRISTIAYGKEKPEVTGSFEEAWGMNRRAVTIMEQYATQAIYDESQE